MKISVLLTSFGKKSSIFQKTHRRYVMKFIERATKTKYEMDVKHEKIRPSGPKQRILPSPHRYSEGEKEAQHDQGIEKERDQFQQ